MRLYQYSQIWGKDGKIPRRNQPIATCLHITSNRSQCTSQSKPKNSSRWCPALSMVFHHQWRLAMSCSSHLEISSPSFNNQTRISIPAHQTFRLSSQSRRLHQTGNKRWSQITIIAGDLIQRSQSPGLLVFRIGPKGIWSMESTTRIRISITRTVGIRTWSFPLQMVRWEESKLDLKSKIGLADHPLEISVEDLTWTLTSTKKTTEPGFESSKWTDLKKGSVWLRKRRR